MKWAFWFCSNYTSIWQFRICRYPQ